MSPVPIWISVTDRHPFLCLPALIVIQFETVHWPWNETRPRAAFLPRRFSAIHSYVPASSCWKLGISRTAFEFFILTLLGKGMPLVLLQLISGTGLQKRNKKFPWWQLSVAVITVWLSTEEEETVGARVLWIIIAYKSNWDHWDIRCLWKKRFLLHCLFMPQS